MHALVAQGEESANPALKLGFQAAWTEYLLRGQGFTNAVIDPVVCPIVDPTITVLWGSSRKQPNWTSKQLSNMNNHSVVLKVGFGRASVLITGDLEDVAIESMVRFYEGTDMLRADVYEVGHHGSHNGTTESLMRAVRPKFAMMETGSNDREEMWTAWAYGHPRKTTVDLLERFVTSTRPRVQVPVGTGAKTFADKTLNKAIYATGWDGTVVLEGTVSGDWRVLSNSDLDSGNVAFVNVNTASLEELMTLPLIGEARAQAIIRSRTQDGPFGSVDELQRVRGIGPGTVSALRPLARVVD